MSEYKRADIEVTLVDSMGSDLSIVNAARVSFDKESEWEYYYASQEEFEQEETVTKQRLSEKDAKLINYLAKHNHWTPFGHVFASFRVKAPFFVARQLGKHQVGLVWNEVSRRYVDGEPEFYIPDTLRGRAENVKQGSSLNAVETPGAGLHYPGIDYLVETALTAYKGLLNDGVAPEQARMVLPQNTMTEWIWSGSLAAWARVCKLRMDPHTQLETGSVAWKIAEELQNVFPVGFKALLEN
ncbi:MAG TPA: FAD-dependent thymidylate synthase [Methanosarcina sp.]|nr:FAD-dependent thymidylate synthase [Methanosarcina sp.]